MRKVLLVATAAAAISCAQGAMAETIIFSGTYDGTGTFTGSFTLDPTAGLSDGPFEVWQITASSFSATGPTAVMWTNPDPASDDTASQFLQYDGGVGETATQFSIDDTNENDTNNDNFTFSVQPGIASDNSVFDAPTGKFAGSNLGGYMPGGVGDSFMTDTITFDPVAAPEPASILLLGAGLAGIGAMRRKRQAG